MGAGALLTISPSILSIMLIVELCFKTSVVDKVGVVLQPVSMAGHASTPVSGIGKPIVPWVSFLTHHLFPTPFIR